MAQVKSGTRDLKKGKPSQVVKSTFDTRKIRCRKCQGLAVATADGKGGTMWKCIGCKSVFTSTPM